MSKRSCMPACWHQHKQSNECTLSVFSRTPNLFCSVALYPLLISFLLCCCACLAILCFLHVPLLPFFMHSH